jgi:hypothetical protein
VKVVWRVRIYRQVWQGPGIRQIIIISKENKIVAIHNLHWLYQKLVIQIINWRMTQFTVKSTQKTLIKNNLVYLNHMNLCKSKSDLWKWVWQLHNKIKISNNIHCKSKTNNNKYLKIMDRILYNFQALKAMDNRFLNAKNK